MRTAVIVNPHSAGGGTGKRWSRVHQMIEWRLGPVEVRFTDRPGHATTLAGELLVAGYDRIVGAGGDGTMHEIANGFFDDDDQPVNPEACLGLLPMGTGGDLRRTLGIPPDVEGAAEVLAGGAVRTIDLGRVIYRDEEGIAQRRYFVNIVSFGMGGEVAAGVRNIFRPMGGQPAFFWATLKVLARYRGKKVALQLDDGEARFYEVLNVVAGNGLYHGGGMHVCPEAVLDDGLLDITVIDELSVLTLLKDRSYLYDGNIHSHPKVLRFRARKLVAESSETVHIEVDGEPLGTLPLEITLLPKALRVLAPAVE